MNFRFFFFTISLFWMGTGLMLGAGSLSEALRQAFDPYSPQWLWTQAVWLVCLSLGPFLFDGKVRLNFTGTKTRYFSLLITVLSLCLGALALDFVWSLFALPGGFHWAWLALLLCFCPGFFAAGLFFHGITHSSEHNPVSPGKILAPCLFGAALGAWMLPSFLYSLAGIKITMGLGGILTGLAGIAVILFQPGSEAPLKTEVQSHFPLTKVAAIVCGLILSVYFLCSLRMLGLLMDGYLPALWISVSIALLSLALGALYYLWRLNDRVRSSIGPALALLVYAVYAGVFFASGDSLAMLAALLRPVGALGTSGNLVSWVLLPLLVMLLPGMALGYVFSALPVQPRKSKAALGPWAISGIAAGFLLSMPQCLGAIPGLRIAGFLAAFLFLIMAWPSLRIPGRVFFLAASVLVIAALCLPGPGMLWKHGAIGQGGLDVEGLDRNQLRNEVNGLYRGLAWEMESRQGFTGVDSRTGPLIMVNGSPQTQARHEEYTQGMLGLLGPILRPKAEKALVLGFSNGCAPAWLALPDAIESVDVACDEKRVRALAKAVGGIPAQILTNPKIALNNKGPFAAIQGGSKKYDIIISNPARLSVSGMSGLYTPSFFKAASNRLNPHGLFIQHIRVDCWDARSLSILYGSLFQSPFSFVRTWMLGPHDLALVCTKESSPLSTDSLNRVVSKEPFKARLARAWSVTDAEGMLARIVVSEDMAGRWGSIALARDWTNTRDFPNLESVYSKAWARPFGLTINSIYNAVSYEKTWRLRLKGSEPDWEKVDHNRLLAYYSFEESIPEIKGLSPMNERRRESYNTLLGGNLYLYYSQQERYFRDSPYPADMFSSAFALADYGSPLALRQISRLKPFWPAGAQTCLAWYYWRTGEFHEAIDELENSLKILRKDPLAHPLEIRAVLGLATKLSKEGKVYSKRLYPALNIPFTDHAFEDARLQALVYNAIAQGPEIAAQTFKAFEPNIPWTLDFLEDRQASYVFTKDPLASRAARDLKNYKFWSP